MKVYLIIGRNIDLKSFPFEKDSIKIGIDRGAFLAIENGITLDYAIGDFDSCSEEEKEQISLHVPNVLSLNPIKDDTDTKHAYSMFKEKKDIKYILLGSIEGKRIEHFYANLELVMKDERVSMLDDSSLIFMTKKPFKISDTSYKFYSFFPIDETAKISLEGFKYDLNEETIYKGEGLTISNEIKTTGALVNIHSGSLLCIFSKNDNR